MDQEIASAGAKLALTEHPVTVLKNKYPLLDLQQEMENLQRGAGEYLAPLPSWWPGWLKRMVSKRRKPRAIPSFPPAYIEKKIQEARARMKELEATNVLEGTLTPLTVGDDYEVNAFFYYIRRKVSGMFEEPETTQEGQQARDEAINISSNLAKMTKQVECVLKQKDDGKWVRALTYVEARKLDPRTLLEIWSEYEKHFVLTDAELGK